MRDKELDKKLYEHYNKIKVPSKFYCIPDKIENLSIDKKKKYIWRLSMACVVLLTICTITFGKSIYLYILGTMAKVHEGISVAIDNNYYATIDMEYSRSNKIEIKVTQILMDDYNLLIGFKIRNNTNSKISKVNFKDMMITDESNNLIFCDDKETYEEYCLKSGMEIKKISEINLTNDGYGIEEIRQENNDFEILYKLYSNKYPRSKELNIEINTLELEDEKGNIKSREGVWKIKINIPKEFYERKYINYQVKDGSDARCGLKIENVVVTSTQTVVTYSGKSKTNQGDRNNLEEKIDNFITGNGSFYDEIRIENENGEIFKTAAVTDAYGTYYSIKEKTFEGRLPFSLTKYHITDRLYLIITKEGKESVINLER